MKVRLHIEETLKYESEIIIEQPESLSDEDLNAILSAIERKSHDADDIAYYLQKSGIKVLDVDSSFPDSPSDTEVEIIDVSNVR